VPRRNIQKRRRKRLLKYLQKKEDTHGKTKIKNAKRRKEIEEDRET
jgi:ribosomal protein S15P/S13E